MRTVLSVLILVPGLMAQAPWEDPVALEARITGDRLTTAEDFLAAARLRASFGTLEGSQSARELALVAWLLGKPNPLVAQAEDAILKTLGRPPRFAGPGEGDAAPTDAHRLDFLMPPLAPMEGVEALQQKRLSEAWRTRTERDRGANTLYQASMASREATLSPQKRKGLLEGFREDRVRTAADLHQAAKVLTRSEEVGDLLLANEWAALAAARGDQPSRILFAQTWDRAAKALQLPIRYGTLGSQTMAPGVAPGVIRNLGFSGRLTSR